MYDENNIIKITPANANIIMPVKYIFAIVIISNR